MDSGGSFLGTLIYLAIIIAMIAGMWKVFEKAGQPGWAAIIPIYNLIVLLQIVGKPIWWDSPFPYTPCKHSGINSCGDGTRCMFRKEQRMGVCAPCAFPLCRIPDARLRRCGIFQAGRSITG